MKQTLYVCMYSTCTVSKYNQYSVVYSRQDCTHPSVSYIEQTEERECIYVALYSLCHVSPQIYVVTPHCVTSMLQHSSSMCML
jgi:hypothetical protein